LYRVTIGRLQRRASTIEPGMDNLVGDGRFLNEWVIEFYYMRCLVEFSTPLGLQYMQILPNTRDMVRIAGVAGS